MSGLGSVHKADGHVWNTRPSTVGPSLGGGTADFQVFLEKALTEKVTSISETAKEEEGEKLREAAKELEAIFIQQMLAAMRATIPEGEGMFAKTFTQKTMESMLDVEYARNFAENAEFGLADAICRQLGAYVKKQENQG